MGDLVPEVANFARLRLCKADDKPCGDGPQKRAPKRRLLSPLIQLLHSVEYIHPIRLLAEEGHRGRATAEVELVVKVLLHSTHHDDGSHGLVLLRAGAEIGHDPVTQFLVHDVLFKQKAHGIGHFAEIGGVTTTTAGDFELLLALVSDEFTAELLRVFVDVQAQLYEDGEPDIIGSNDKMVVLVVGVDSGVDEAIALGADGVIEIVCLERRLEKLLAVGVLLVAGTL